MEPPKADNKHAFTLIELLIVVAIIAILVAIAVTNFLKAQTRSKIARNPLPVEMMNQDFLLSIPCPALITVAPATLRGFALPGCGARGCGGIRNRRYRGQRWPGRLVSGELRGR